MIPTVDLRERFRLPPHDSTAMTRVIVVEVEGRPVGMVVDSATRLEAVAGVE